MGRHVHVKAEVAKYGEDFEADAGAFDEPVVLDTGLVQCAPSLFVAGSAFISAEYHDDHEDA